MKDPLFIACVTTLLKFIYLECGIHNALYGKFYNGYVAISLLALCLGTPIWGIATLLMGRALYRKSVCSESYGNIYDIKTTLIFLIGIYICCYIKS